MPFRVGARRVTSVLCTESRYVPEYERGELSRDPRSNVLLVGALVVAIVFSRRSVERPCICVCHMHSRAGSHMCSDGFAEPDNTRELRDAFLEFVERDVVHGK